MKTNATRLLDQLKIGYELREYEVDPADLSAETVASKIGLPVEQVFKTLVVKSSQNIYFAVVRGDHELDLKALAKLAGERKIELVPLKDVQSLTGYVRGGVTALTARKDYPVFVDQSITCFATVSVSAGVRGTQILLSPEEYVKVTKAVPGFISKPKQP